MSHTSVTLLLQLPCVQVFLLSSPFNISSASTFSNANCQHYTQVSAWTAADWVASLVPKCQVPTWKTLHDQKGWMTADAKAPEGHWGAREATVSSTLSSQILLPLSLLSHHLALLLPLVHLALSSLISSCRYLLPQGYLIPSEFIMLAQKISFEMFLVFLFMLGLKITHSLIYWRQIRIVNKKEITETTAEELYF